MKIGQIVWHVGKNIPLKEFRVLWISPSLSPESPVLVEAMHDIGQHPWRLIPKRTLSETKPFIQCNSYFLLSLTQEVRCVEGKDHFPNHHAKIGSEGAELFWPVERKPA